MLFCRTSLLQDLRHWMHIKACRPMLCTNVTLHLCILRHTQSGTVWPWRTAFSTLCDASGVQLHVLSSNISRLFMWYSHNIWQEVIYTQLYPHFGSRLIGLLANPDKCAGAANNWQNGVETGACISNDGGASYQWHCPWESDGLVSGFGCSAVKSSSWLFSAGKLNPQTTLGYICLAHCLDLVMFLYSWRMSASRFEWRWCSNRNAAHVVFSAVNLLWPVLCMSYLALCTW